jgi:hypothetical protein
MDVSLPLADAYAQWHKDRSEQARHLSAAAAGVIDCARFDEIAFA